MNLKKGLQYVCARMLLNVCASALVRPNMSLVIDQRCHEQMNFIRSIDASLLDNETVVKDSLESSLSILRENVTGLVQYQQCARRLNQAIHSCWNKARTSLAKANLIAAKLIRWSLTDLEDLLHRIPDIRIIHYVRDPRAIVTSRIPVNPSSSILTRTPKSSISEESRALCIRMLDDLNAKRFLQGKYPGAIMTVRYEDFVLLSAQTIDRVFQFIDRSPHVGISSWIWNSMNGKRDSGQFGTVRVNSSVLVDNWKRKVSYGNATIMNSHCREVLQRLGYEPLSLT